MKIKIELVWTCEENGEWQNSQILDGKKPKSDPEDGYIK